MRLIARGKTHLQVALVQGVRPQTIKNRLADCRKKARTHNTLCAVLVAIAIGELEMPSLKEMTV